MFIITKHFIRLFYKVGVPAFDTYVLIVVVYLLSDFCLCLKIYSSDVSLYSYSDLLLHPIYLEYLCSSFCFQAVYISLWIFASGVHFLLTANSWAYF